MIVFLAFVNRYPGGSGVQIQKFNEYEPPQKGGGGTFIAINNSVCVTGISEPLSIVVYSVANPR